MVQETRDYSGRGTDAVQISDRKAYVFYQGDPGAVVAKFSASSGPESCLEWKLALAESQALNVGGVHKQNEMEYPVRFYNWRDTTGGS